MPMAEVDQRMVVVLDLSLRHRFPDDEAARLLEMEIVAKDERIGR
jgi:hypothetical protein